MTALRLRWQGGRFCHQQQSQWRATDADHSHDRLGAKTGPGARKTRQLLHHQLRSASGNDWQYFSQAGNGVITNTSIQITTNNPNDANFLTNSAFQQAFVQHLTNRWGLSTNGGVQYYFMDNEHSIWYSTHRTCIPSAPRCRKFATKCSTTPAW